MLGAIWKLPGRLRVLRDLSGIAASPADRSRMVAAYLTFGDVERAARPLSASVKCGTRRVQVLLTNRMDFWGAYYVFSGEGYGRARTPSSAAILDVGANVGYSSLYLAERFPDCIVHAIEPDPGNYERLVENCGHHPRIRTHRIGIGAEPGELPFFVYPGRHMSSSFSRRSPDQVEVRAEVMTLDAFCDRQGIGRIGLLKVDVEGFETEVLKGLADPARVEQYIGELHFDLMDKPREWFERRLAMTLSGERKGDRALVHGVRADIDSRTFAVSGSSG